MTIEPMCKKYILCNKPLYDALGKLTNIIGSFDTIKEALVFASLSEQEDKGAFEVLDRPTWRALSRMAEKER